MAGISDIISAVKTLGDYEIDAVIKYIKSLQLTNRSLGEILLEEKSKNGFTCPHCSSVHFKKNGLKGKMQRYLCKDCGKSFNIKTGTIVNHTKLQTKQILDILIANLEGESCRKIAGKLGLNKDTVFLWRHKLMDSATLNADTVNLSGIVESDETYLAISFKGNHKNDGFTMPRFSRKHGKLNKVRGISQELVSVCVALDRNDNIIAKPTNLGRSNAKDFHNLLDFRIRPDSVLVTDKAKAYEKFAKDNHLKHIAIKGGKGSVGVYHIQHVNNYHRTFKQFLEPYNGVATKYLPNYLTMFSLGYKKGVLDVENKNAIFTSIISKSCTSTRENMAKRSVLPIYRTPTLKYIHAKIKEWKKAGYM